MVNWETLISDYSGYFLALALYSLVSMLIAVPIGVYLTTRLPSDYFINVESRRNHKYLNRYPKIVRLVLPVASNFIGILLIVLGIIMLITPGQGILTIMAGLILTNFPGKFAFEKWFFRRHYVNQTVNWLRKRKGLAPFQLD